MEAKCVAFGCVILLFVFLSVLFQQGKGENLIAGYNTMSEAERARFDRNKLMKIMSRGMISFALCMALSLAGVILHSKQLVSAGFGLLALAAIVLVILSNTKTKR